MAQRDKPYRVHRGGRTKGRVPLQRRVEQAPQARRRPPGAPGHRRALRASGAAAPAWPPRRDRARRAPAPRARLGLRELLRARARARRDQRLGPVALDAQAACSSPIPRRRCCSEPTTAPEPDARARSVRTRSCSCAPTRTGDAPRSCRSARPAHRRAWPRLAKINAAYQFGGQNLAVQTVKAYRAAGQPHGRGRLPELRAADRRARRRDDRRAEPILSNRFDCPYSTQERCQRWGGWRFAAGAEQT